MIEEARNILAIAVIIAGVALFALREWLRSTFPTVQMVQDQAAVDRKTVQELADATADDLDGIGKKVERLEKFTFAQQDAIAQTVGRTDKLSNELDIVRQYGSIPMQEVLRDQRKILRRLDQISIHMGLEIPDEEVGTK